MIEQTQTSKTLTNDFVTVPRKAPEGLLNIIGLTRSSLKEALIESGTPEKQANMRVGQIWQWIYEKGIRDFGKMTNLAKPYREALKKQFLISVPEIISKNISQDGTRKYLMRINGEHEVETVYIPEENRGTLCISSQVGCTLTCSFCHTGTQRLVRNLTSSEIVGQILAARDDLGEWPNQGVPKTEPRMLSNIVLMGMGEPCLLYTSPSPRD